MLPDSWPPSSTPPPTSDERGSLTMTTTNTSGDGGHFPAAPGRVHRHEHLAPRALLPGMQRVPRIPSSTASTPSSRSERAHRGAEEAEEAEAQLQEDLLHPGRVNPFPQAGEQSNLEQNASFPESPLPDLPLELPRKRRIREGDSSQDGSSSYAVVA